MCGRSHIKNKFILSEVAPASSKVSRSAPSDTVSLFSKKPAGSVQRPSRGSIALLHIKILFSQTSKHPDTTFGFS